MKIAVTGKGGVGKSTLVGLLARGFAARGWKVLAVDADPDANLGAALGIPAERLEGLQPISRMVDLARERTGATQGAGTHFILNPKVDDIPERFAVTHEGVQMLLMGTVDHAGTGCVCPEHALLRTLLKHLLTRRRECVLVDMEAGIEHFGRGTVGSVDLLLVVVEPGQRSLQTARQITRLASELGLSRIAYVGSKVRSTDDAAFIARQLGDGVLLGSIPFDPVIAEADRAGKSCFDMAEHCRQQAFALCDACEGALAQAT